MRLMYFVQYFPPEKASGLPLVEDLISGFAEQGWNVDVYTTTPTRGVSANVRKEYSKRKLETRCDGRLRIHRMRLYREGEGFFQRTIRYTIFSLMCLCQGLTEQADAFFTGNGPPTQGVIGGLLKKWTKKKFIFNPQDLFPDSMINAGIIRKGSKIEKIGRTMERFGYSNADAIITISEDMRRSILNKGIDPEKVAVIPNWIDTNTIKPVPREENKLFDELELSRDKFYVVYAGNIGYVQGIDNIIETAQLLRNEEEIHFVIFGNGSEESRIRQMIEDYQLPNVSLYPLLEPERVSEVYSIGDVSLVTCKAGTGGAGMPSKTWTIMATGTPVLGFFDKPSEFSNLLESTQTGWCVEAGNTEELCAKVVELHQNMAQCKEYGKNAREYAESHLSKDMAVGQYIEIIERQIRG